MKAGEANLMEREQDTGLNVQAHTRRLLLLAGLTWEETCKLDETYNHILYEVKWLSLDNGKTFDLTFDPTKKEK